MQQMSPQNFLIKSKQYMVMFLKKNNDTRPILKISNLTKEELTHNDKV